VQVYCLFFTGSVRRVNGEGMPHHKNPYEKGDLYVKFEIIFPPKYFNDENKIKVMLQCNECSWLPICANCVSH